MQDILFLVAITIGVFVLITVMRRGSSAVKSKPKRIKLFTTKIAANEVMKIISRFAQQNKYKIDEIDEDSGRLILSDSVDLTSFGFFYPVYVSKQREETLVEVGIKSKVFQIGPVVGRKHEQCFNGIKAAIFADKSGNVA